MFVMYEKENMKVPVRVWLKERKDLEGSCLEQAYHLSQLPFLHKWVSLMPDTHAGKGMPIGGVIAADGVVIPNAVGVDIGCGMAYTETNIRVADIREVITGNGSLIQAIVGDIMRNVPVGFAHHKTMMPSYTMDCAFEEMDRYEAVSYTHLTLAVFPYGNMGCVIEATGQQIKDALEMASKNCPEESGGFLQVSGLTYTIDTSVRSGVQTDDKGNFTGVSGAYRVTDIKVAGEPIDLNRTYTVASHNYMLKQGGDGMTMFKGCNVIRDEVMVDVDILSSYIRRMGGFVTSEYANPAGQGRITIR